MAHPICSSRLMDQIMSSASPETDNAIEQIKRAFRADDAAKVRELLNRYPELKERINDPVGPFDSPAIVNVRNGRLLDVLLDAGADINARSQWWAGGFGLLDGCDPDLAAYAIERGAVVDAHAASRLGMIDRLRDLIGRDPGLVQARGGDGQTPLHFASTIEIAAYLLGQGAEIDTRDVDHESTPAQWMVKDRQEVARYLITRGCQTDILMAAALGDSELVRRHLEADPDSIRMRVTDEYFPMTNPKAGGTIFQWTLGFYLSAHDVSRKFGHDGVLRLLLERSPLDVKLIDACWSGNDATARAIRAANPEIIRNLSQADRRQPARAARNNDIAAVRLMLECGFPVDARGQHQATPLHWAAFHGNAEMTNVILGFGPPLEAIDADFQGTPLDWAMHGSEHGWNCETGDFGATVEALLEAGAKRPATIRGSAAVQNALRRIEP
jgi:ankyrin repeat protein